MIAAGPGLLLLTSAAAVAAPSEAAPATPGPTRADWQGLARLDPDDAVDPDVLVVKLRQDAGLAPAADGSLRGPPGRHLDTLRELLAGSRPLVPRALEDDEPVPPGLADLSTYLRLEHPEAPALGRALLAHPWVELAYLAPLPAPPPEDIAPETPDFTGLQEYLGAAPDGLGFDIAHRWPGGDGANITIAQLEFGWEPGHEDLPEVPLEPAWGSPTGQYSYHGNSVLGMLVGLDNDYGVTGLVPGAEVLLLSPYDEAGDYNVAAAVDAAVALLDPGDIVLIELQAYVLDTLGPVEHEPAVFDAITRAVAAGIVVVEPGGNGALDLDDPELEGWFDRELQDSGAIMVGGGASPMGGLEPRTWYLNGSSHGARIDLQGWFDHIVTTASSELADSYADLFYPDGDGAQAYTSRFGGTSGASPMVAATAAVANSVAWERWGEPWAPLELRAALVQTGTPQPPEDPYLIGPLPDLRRLVRTWGLR